VSQLSLAPVETDLELYAGDGVSITLTATNPNGTAMNLTGVVIAQIVNERTDSAPLVSFTVDTTNASTGRLVLSLTGAQTATLLSGNLDPFRGFWDVQWTGAGAQPLTLMQGTVTCDLDVSH